MAQYTDELRHIQITLNNLQCLVVEAIALLSRTADLVPADPPSLAVIQAELASLRIEIAQLRDRGNDFRGTDDSDSDSDTAPSAGDP